MAWGRRERRGRHTVLEHPGSTSMRGIGAHCSWSCLVLLLLLDLVASLLNPLGFLTPASSRGPLPTQTRSYRYLPWFVPVQQDRRSVVRLSDMSQYEKNRFELAFEADGNVLEDGVMMESEGMREFSLLERQLLLDSYEEKKLLHCMLDQLSAPDLLAPNSDGDRVRMRRFMNAFSQTLRKAGYRLLSERDVAMSEAMSAQGVLRSDIVTDESSFLRLLPRNDTHHCVSPRILVWRRGVSVEEVSGSLYLQKLDYLQSSILLALWRSALEMLQGVWEEMEVARSMLRDGSSTLLDDLRSVVGMSGPDKVRATLDETLASAEQTLFQLAVKLLERWGLVSPRAAKPLSDFHPSLLASSASYDVVRFVGLSEGIQNAYEAAVAAVGANGLQTFFSAFLRPVYLEDPVFESVVVMYARKKRGERSNRVGVLPFLVSFVRLLSLYAVDPRLPFLSDRPLVPGRTGQIHVRETFHDNHVFTEYSIDVRDVKDSGCLRLLISLLYKFRSGSRNLEFKIPFSEPFALVKVGRSRVNIVMLNSKRADQKTPREREEAAALEIIGYQSVNIQNIKSIWPDRQLQFRPLDSLRLDLVTFTTLASVLAQVKLDNPYTDAAALVTTTAWILGAIFRFNARRNAYELQSSRGLARRITARGFNVIRMAGDKAFQQQITKSRLVYNTVRCAGPLDVSSIARECQDRLKEQHPANACLLAQEEIVGLLNDLKQFSLVEERDGQWQASKTG
eukprot:761813-Hanusia_phi.AAC.2